MEARSVRSRLPALAIVLGLALVVAACGKKEPPAAADTSAAAPAAPATQGATPTPAATAATAGPTSWTPEALEELLAPVALYPDPILSQVLIASTNPQEVLDGGNWLLQNQGLKGKALSDAAAKVGFTPPLLALVQFPDTLDMMCRELDWTTELGQAFTADQAGVLDAVQRLRKQAESVGNLKSSPQMQVDNTVQDGKEVVVLKPASDGVVYVPQYDPVAVYAPPPATAVAPATTTTTTTTESTGYSTGAMVTTGLLSFGAGLLVADLFDDDDHHHNNGYYYPNYGYGGMPYYPPYSYRPSYGNGYYPSNGYRPPPGYGGRYGGGNNFVNNGNIVVTNPGGRGGNDYWDRQKNDGRTRQANSPITQARPNRPEMNDLNKRQPRPMPADVKRPSTTQTASDWKGQKGYAGATNAASNRTAKTNAGPSGSAQRPAPKVQGSYAGGTSASRPSTGQSTYQGAANKVGQSSSKGAAAKTGQSTYQGSAAKAGQSSSKGGDRGYSQQANRPQPTSRPQPSAKPQQQVNRPAPSSKPAQQGGGHNNAMSSSNRGSADRQASQRGKQSMPQGAHSKGGGGGGGKGKKGR
jgi:hypothetical protein